EAAGVALPVPGLALLALDEIAQLGFETVVVARTAHRFLGPELGHETSHVHEVLHEVVVLRFRLGDIGGELRQPLDYVVERSFAVERISAPGAVEIALLDEVGSCSLQYEARAESVAIARATPQDAAHALGWIGQDGLEPALETLAVQALFFLLG